MPKGHVSIVLHTHLPFVRNPKEQSSLAERWLFEAIHESYIPLLMMLDRLAIDSIPIKLTMSFSPTIISMLEDDYLNQQFELHLIKLIELCEKEMKRNLNEKELYPICCFYHKRFKEQLIFYKQYDKNLMNGFRKFYKLGILESITCSATHALLPLLSLNPEALKAQIHTGIKTFETCFGDTPKGFWLPECGYAYGIDTYLKNAGIKYFISEDKAVLSASPKPLNGSYAPIVTQNGIAVFPRDGEASEQVWSSIKGYPGDSCYREFYRDIGYQLPIEDIQQYLNSSGLRSDTGLKYHRVTGNTEDKQLYQRAAALERAIEHGNHFAQSRNQQINELASNMKVPPIITCPYDTELFGHWWFEGPEFLEAFIRSSVYSTINYKLETPSGYLKQHPLLQCSIPTPSSWGINSDFSTWLNSSTHWIYMELNKCETAIIDFVSSSSEINTMQTRILRQAAKELMLAQASDWPFMITKNTTVAFGVKQVSEHIDNFWKLIDMAAKNFIDEHLLSTLENKNNLFPAINLELYKKDS